MLDIETSSFEAILLECFLDNDTFKLRFDRHLYPSCESYGIFQVEFVQLSRPKIALEFYRHFIGYNIAIWMIPHSKGFQLVDYYYDEDWQTGMPDYPELYCQNYSMSDEPHSIEYLKSIIGKFHEENARLENDLMDIEDRQRRQDEQIDRFFREEINRASLKADGVADDQAKVKYLEQRKALEKAYKAVQFIREKRG